MEKEMRYRERAPKGRKVVGSLGNMIRERRVSEKLNIDSITVLTVIHTCK